MTIVSRPWANTTPGDAGPYTDAEWATMYTGLLNADEANRGVLISTEHDGFEVTEKSGTPDMSVDVSIGEALVSGRWVSSDAITNLAVAAADPTLNRYDLVVIRTDASLQTAILAVKTGTPAASPSVPSLDQTGSPYFEIPLAHVYVAAAATSITDSVITDRRSAANIPLRLYAYVQNQAASSMAPGHIVVWDDTNAGSVKFTTTADDPNIAGVAADVIASSDYGRICIAGIIDVHVDGAVAIGDVVCAGSTASKSSNSGANSIGRMLESTAAAGKAKAIINAQSGHPGFGQYLTAPGSGDTLSTITTWSAFPTNDLVTTLTTRGGDLDVSASFCVRQAGGTNPAIFFDIDIDGTRVGSTAGLVQLIFATSDVAQVQVSIPPIRVTGIAAGSHTVRVKYYITGSGMSFTVAGSSSETRMLRAEEVRR